MSGKRQRLVKDFTSVTGSDEGTAKHFLDACSDNLETAIAMFLDNKGDNSSASKSLPDDDNVRAPIPQTSGVLVDDPHYVTTSRDRWNSRRRPRSAVFDGFRDFKAETTQQEALLTNPGRSHRMKRLEDLFRPPLELMHRGTLETAREAGKQLNKWLMINVQNVREFSCQVLNRDIWSKASIQRTIKENFIFWQVYNDSTEGDRFTTFYPVSSWPHVSILDPRTGERLAVWNEINTNNFDGKVEEFLADHGKIGEETDLGPPAKKSKRDHSVIDDSEDSQLAAAIAASLSEPKPLPRNLLLDNDDSDFIASNDCSDISGFDGTSDEENFILDSDSNDCAEIPKKNDKKSAQNSDNDSIEKTKIDDDFFSSKTTKNSTVEPKKSGKQQNGTSKHTEVDKKSETDSENSQEKSYKKVNSRLKVGTVENGKDMSNLTNDIYGETSTNSAVIPQKPAVIPQKPAVIERDVCRIMVRYPDGTREEIQMEIDMTVKDLSAELTRKGYPREDYDVVTNFPRKSIFSFSMKKTLKQAGLYPRAAVFVEEKECG